MKRTVTLEINELYFDKFISFLEVLPKKMVTIKNSEIEYHKKMIEKSIEDINKCNTIKVRKI